MIKKEGELQEYKNTLAEVREYPEDNDAALPKEKIGTIEEAFFTIKKEPCYWVVGEKELVMGDQIIGLA